MNTSKKLFGAIGGTLNCPIGPKSGANAPNGCEFMLPLTGSESPVVDGLSHRMWKRTSVPTSVQSRPESVGCGRAHWQTFVHTSIVAATPSHTKFTLKQQIVPTGVPGGAVTAIRPTQFSGTGFGAGVLSVLSSVAV